VLGRPSFYLSFVRSGELMFLPGLYHAENLTGTSRPASWLQTGHGCVPQETNRFRFGCPQDAENVDFSVTLAVTVALASA
jgi:hypothetical protein